MRRIPDVLISWNTDAPASWSTRALRDYEPYEMSAGQPVVHVTGDPTAWLTRDFEMYYMRLYLEDAGLEVFEDDFNRLGPWFDTVRGLDVTLGWDDMYTPEELERSHSPIDVVVHAHPDDFTTELMAAVSGAVGEAMAWYARPENLTLAQGDSQPVDDADDADAEKEDRWPHLPPDALVDSLLFAERRASFVQGLTVARVTPDTFGQQDKMKGGPGELSLIEFDVADLAFAEGTEAHLRPTPGWTLPAETRRRLQQRSDFALRTLAGLTRAPFSDYYQTDGGADPQLPGEVADYMGVPFDQHLVIPVEGSEHQVRLARSAEGVTRLYGLGAVISSRWTRGGEVNLVFRRGAELSVWPNGFWTPVEQAVTEPQSSLPSVEWRAVLPWMSRRVARLRGIDLGGSPSDREYPGHVIDAVREEQPGTRFSDLFDMRMFDNLADLALDPTLDDSLERAGLDVAALHDITVDRLRKHQFDQDDIDALIYGFVRLTILSVSQMGPFASPLELNEDETQQRIHEILVHLLETHDVWTAQTYMDGVELAPYIQALHEFDGGWTCEVSSEQFLSRPLTLDQKQALRFLGWDEPAPHDRLPNYHQAFAMGSDPARIADVLVATLFDVYELSLDDTIEFMPRSPELDRFVARRLQPDTPDEQ